MASSFSSRELLAKRFNTTKGTIAARKYAGIVFKENDPEVVEEIINMMDSVGEKTVRKAFDKVAKKAVNNPKRNYAYAKGIIKSLGK